MCGIVGYIGERKAVPILIEGLSALEYRGYDSAGLAMVGDEQLHVHKVKGKVDALRERIKSERLDGTVGIAHTRWATHGGPSEPNAHPHTDHGNAIAVVHNGIIENYAAIKERLKRNGVSFKSETDTEVLAQLIGKYYTDGDLVKAVTKALSDIEGTFGIAVIARDNPDLLIGARRGSPLVVGIGEDEYLLGSDTSAIVAHTDKVIYLKDGHLATLTRNGYSTLTLDNRPASHKVHTLEYGAEALAKGGFDHFMLKEIFEQPETIQNAMRGRLLTEEGTARLDGLNLVMTELRRINRIIFVACGTSWHAALCGEYLMEDLAGIPVEVEYASEFRYRNPIIDSKTLVFVISQSGETADTLAALREAAHKGATVLGICNVVGSSIARETHGGVYLHAGPEIGVASTKAFTSQLTVLSLLTLLMGRMRRISHDDGMAIAKGLDRIPSQVRKILKQNDYIAEIAAIYSRHNNFLYLGRSYNYPVALEGALKLKEISYVHAEGYPAAEMKHGPIALIDTNMPSVVVALKDSVYEKVISNMEEIRARSGKIIAIATEGDKTIQKHADHVVYIPKTLPVLTPLLAVIPLQLLAYHIAAIRKCEIDQPRNLAKSVTVE
ncbi:MAG: glutamine--fructose-6-phosphate transaminase (isomerizing) [Chitinivibrionales bacterium]|nr:glutamine--fructose-6-phosphate transaminase (isomerizing) [Chitinivibrionales bacterium]MBD3358367.1 glutamine--fructose-6-phosphate transaminase (isomerizing) [Chitinivibrionales bacterium]